MLFFLIILLSAIPAFFLARLSMRDYQEHPSLEDSYALYLIRQPLKEDVLSHLYQMIAHYQNRHKGKLAAISFESLVKGSSLAYVLYGPKQILSKNIQELDLLELEDYTTQLNRQKIQAWEIGPVKTSDTLRIYDQKTSLFKDLELSDNEYFFLQITSSPQTDNTFQATIRAVVIAPTATRRSEIARNINNQTKIQFGLGKIHNKKSSLKVFENYKERSFIPKEVKKQYLDISEIAMILKS